MPLGYKITCIQPGTEKCKYKIVVTVLTCF